jgi:hypothetical protein
MSESEGNQSMHSAAGTDWCFVAGELWCLRLIRIHQVPPSNFGTDAACLSTLPCMQTLTLMQIDVSTLSGLPTQ